MKALMNNSVGNKQFSWGFVKFAVCLMLVGLAYRLLLSNSVQFSTVLVATDSASVAADETLPLPVSSDELLENVDEDQSSEIVKCDLFVGDWVPDSRGPFYTNETCNSIQTHQNCMSNGRPDTDYIYWRWKPRDCELPRFNPRKFLNFMKNKSMAFIGDSIMRNHIQSLLCILSQEEKVEEVYHDEQYKSRRWYFPANDFTLSVVWSPYLAKATIFEDDNGVSTDIVQLHLDKLDEVWTEQFKNFDYAVVAGGKWYMKPAIYYENGVIVGCHSCPGKNITEVGLDFAYRRAMNSTLGYIASSKRKVYTFFRTTTPSHFENGEWNTGGYCNRTRPFKEGEAEIDSTDELMRRIEVEEFEKALAVGSEKELSLKLFDTTYVSLLRPDGHPGIYRQFHPLAGKDKGVKVQNDCLHWCLPGPIDSWNDLMMAMLLHA
nr:protein trichome birefringence-like 25 [Ipomoea batatas]